MSERDPNKVGYVTEHASLDDLLADIAPTAPQAEDAAFCEHGDLAPASGDWMCPVCDAEWPDDGEPGR